MPNLLLLPPAPTLRLRLWQVGAVLAFWMEYRLFTDLRGHYGPYASPVLFYSAAVLLCVFALLCVLDQPAAAPAPATGNRLLWAWAVALVGSVRVLYQQAPVLFNNPIDVRSSDVVPILQTYVARFRSGEVVYRYLTNLPYPLFPNHLPLQWAPYIIADELGIDYRWWSMGILGLVGFVAYLAVLNRQRMHWLVFAVLAYLPWFLLRRIIKHDFYIYAQSAEMTIIAYYCLLAAAVLTRSAVAQGVVLVLCLLSRYSVVLWVPLFLWILWREAGWRHALLVAGITGAGLVGLYIMPFLSKDWTIFTHALSEYRIATLGEWSRHDASGHPPHVFNGLGLAAFFYPAHDGLLAARIALLQRVHLLASGGVVALMGGVYWWLRGRVSYQAFALLALKLYLATFYAFIQLPYAYLISLSPFISLFALIVALRAPVRGAADVSPALASPQA